jgi:hypothetical protein
VKEWREKVMDKRLWNLDPVIGIQRIVLCRIEKIVKKMLYVSKHKEDGKGLFKISG